MTSRKGWMLLTGSLTPSKQSRGHSGLCLQKKKKKKETLLIKIKWEMYLCARLGK